MARRRQARAGSGRTILVVDDNPEYLASVARLLAREGHDVVLARSGPEALGVVDAQSVDLVLVDYLMPEMSGERFVVELRKKHPFLQVVLQTGYATEHPPREVLRRLDIQGYHDKTEGPEKLLLWTDVGLKSAKTAQQLELGRQGLRYVLGATPELHRIQPLEDLLQGILLQAAGLLGSVHGFVAVVRRAPGLVDDQSGFLAMQRDGADLVVRAGMGRFAVGGSVRDGVGGELLASLDAIFRQGHSAPAGSGIALPLRVGEVTLGVVFLDVSVQLGRDTELLEIFANQAAVAIHNAQLYEMAALDALTGAYTRRFFEQALLRELRSAHRTGKPTSLLLVDIDNMKRINDAGGHLGGDQALAAVGNLLRRATRGVDLVGRYGGDEFAVLLPSTDGVGARAVVDRILKMFDDLSVAAPAGALPVRGSVGLGVLKCAETGPEPPMAPSADYFTTLGQAVIEHADRALYAAKRAGRGCASDGLLMSWPPVDCAPSSGDFGLPAHDGPFWRAARAV